MFVMLLSTLSYDDDDVAVFVVVAAVAGGGIGCCDENYNDGGYSQYLDLAVCPLNVHFSNDWLRHGDRLTGSHIYDYLENYHS